MLYNEFLAGTGAIDNQANYNEYKRVVQIYMESDHCTKEDAYRMAKVITEKDIKKQRKDEIEWVKQNIISAAAFVRGMSEKNGIYYKNFVYASPVGNVFELALEREFNGGSVRLYEFFANGKKIDTSSTGRSLIDSAEIQSYRADWHDKSLKELEDLFGYIA